MLFSGAEQRSPSAVGVTAQNRLQIHVKKKKKSENPVGDEGKDTGGIRDTSTSVFKMKGMMLSDRGQYERDMTFSLLMPAC